MITLLLSRSSLSYFKSENEQHRAHKHMEHTSLHRSSPSKSVDIFLLPRNRKTHALRARFSGLAASIVIGKFSIQLVAHSAHEHMRTNTDTHNIP